jgi:ankyrin repeat protein
MKTARFLLVLLTATSLTSCISMVHRSVDRGDLAGVRAEIESGVSPETLDYRDKTPLLLAAEQGQYEIAEYLLAAGADVDATTIKDSGEVTPLRYAIDRRDFLMVKLFVENGADVNKANTHGWTPLMTAARVGDREIMAYLIDQGADIRARTADGTTALRTASNYGWTDIVVWLTMMLEEE